MKVVLFEVARKHLRFILTRGSDPETDASVIAQYPGRTVYYLAKGRLSTTAPLP